MQKHMSTSLCIAALGCFCGVLPLALIWPGRTRPELCFWHQQRHKPCCCPLSLSTLLSTQLRDAVFPLGAQASQQRKASQEKPELPKKNLNCPV